MFAGESEKIVTFLLLVCGISVTVGSSLLMMRKACRMVAFFIAGGTHLMVPSILSFWCSVKCKVYGPCCLVVLCNHSTSNVTAEKYHASARP